jgi:hypothetical protein
MIHILFCPSAAGTLRQVLRARNRRERVVDLTEWLDWGPIDFRDFKQRCAWFDQNVPSAFAGGWEWMNQQIGEFKAGVEGDYDRTIWIEPLSANELAGLYWYLENFGGSDAQLLVAPRFKSMCGLGVRGIESMADLLDNFPREYWDPARFPDNSWTTLAAEHAHLRVVENGLLQSVPSDYFDHYLLRGCSSTWTEWMRVVGNTMININDAGHRVDDLFLQWRLGNLIQSDAVETDGHLPRYGEQSKMLVRVAS